MLNIVFLFCNQMYYHYPSISTFITILIIIVGTQTIYSPLKQESVKKNKQTCFLPY